MPGVMQGSEHIFTGPDTFPYMLAPLGMVDLFYTSDMDVVGDWELQALAGDVFLNGFSKIKSSPAPGLGVPSCLKTKTELVDYLQKIIYTSGTRHNFANFYNCEWPVTVVVLSAGSPSSPQLSHRDEGQLPTEEGRGKV